MSERPQPDLLADDRDPVAAELRRELAATREQVAQLERALASRIVIEQAKGKLAERYAFTPQEAFELLRRAARSARMSIHALADDVVGSAATPAELERELPPRAQ